MDFLKRSLTSLSHPSATDEDLETLLKSEDGGTSLSSKYAIPTTASRTIKKIIITLLPSPIQRRLAPHLYKPSRIHLTSYLDGLRGLQLPFPFLSFPLHPLCFTARAKCRDPAIMKFKPPPCTMKTKFELHRSCLFYRLRSPLYQLGATLPSLLWRGYREKAFIPRAITICSRHILRPTNGPYLLRYIGLRTV